MFDSVVIRRLPASSRNEGRKQTKGGNALIAREVETQCSVFELYSLPYTHHLTQLNTVEEIG